MRICSLAGLSLALVLAPSWGAAQPQPNEIFVGLTQQGVLIDGKAVKLPPPAMPDGLSAEAQRKALAGIPKLGHPVDQLLERGVNAPFELRIEGKASQGPVRTVDMWFVAYGDLETVRNRDFLKRQVEEEKGSKPKTAEEKSKATTLAADDLEQRNIRLTAPPDEKEQYANALFRLFDRVRISGSARTLQTNTNESVTMALALDDRFLHDPQFPNQWQSIKRDELGQATLGPPQEYRGAGAYVKATRLAAPKDAILVEYHIAFNEPGGWFNGAPLLTSKLFPLAQDGVRKFRRNLKENGAGR